MANMRDTGNVILSPIGFSYTLLHLKQYSFRERELTQTFLNNMKLLIVTQAVDTEDPVLGFFVRWIEEFAKHSEHIEVICLKEGRHALPGNVRVHSLGKEHGAVSRMTYAFRFLLLVWKLRHEYDAVFVHMNQEYILIAGLFWKLFKKRTYLWRNHYAGSWLTDAAALFCAKVFCTSQHSYTAKYKKTVLMPVGVDTERFSLDGRIARKPKTILFLARMAPSKRPEMVIDALAMLARDGVSFSATFVGSPLPQDEAYLEHLKERARPLSVAGRITFLPGVPNDQTPDLYRAHEVFVNASPSGMLDKTLFEAAACGALVLASSDDFREMAGDRFAFETPEGLSNALTKILAVSDAERTQDLATLARLAKIHSLSGLGARLEAELYCQ